MKKFEYVQFKGKLVMKKHLDSQIDLEIINILLDSTLEIMKSIRRQFTELTDHVIQLNNKLEEAESRNTREENWLDQLRNVK